MLTVTPEEVAAFAPGAPAVSEDQVQEALDWAELLLERAHVELQPSTPQDRAARRAVMNYALAVASEGKASTTRVSAPAAKAKRIKVDVIEIERPTGPDGQTLAEGLTISAGEYHTRAWQALYAAGVPRPKPAVGASR
jgi:hypothetical protein